MRLLLALYIALYAPGALGGCPEALKACDDAVQANVEALKHLKEDYARLEKSSIEASKPPLIPFVIMLGVSVVTFGAGTALSVPILTALGPGPLSAP
jgi:hypothetical protein